MIAFGPIPSRRLGRSLGINNIPPKTCSYSCIYCQVGCTNKMQIERQQFFNPTQIFSEVQDKIRKLKKKGEQLDYLSFVPDGEPTLDIRLGYEIDLLRLLNTKIAVFTNASLIWREEVREELAKADWVSLKIDALFEKAWRKVDRPHGEIQLPAILAGIREFSNNFNGELAIETMLVKSWNDHRSDALALGEFLKQIKFKTAYLSIPTRPPAVPWIKPPNEVTISNFYHTLKKNVNNVEYLIGYEGNAFAQTGNFEDDILSITAVHPMRKEAVRELLCKTGKDWNSVQNLLNKNLLYETEFNGKKYYMRKFNNRNISQSRISSANQGAAK